MITIADFKKIEMKIGTILVAKYVEGADKLLRLEVDFGPKKKEDNEESGDSAEEARPVVAMEPLTTGERDIRQILSGIREYYSPEQLIGKQCPFVTNLEPRMLRGLKSNGMILAVKTEDGGAIILHPDKPTEAGNLLS